MFNLIERAQAYSYPALTFRLRGDLLDVINGVVTWFLTIAGAIAVIYLVYGGLLYITAGGDAEKATKGRTAIINAVIGIVIIVLALLIAQWAVSVAKK